MQTLSLTPAAAPNRTINTASKDLLARILATENITVQHDPKASTAMFDVRNRVLTLPAWTGMSNEVYDMLVGHEVGHALFTPHTSDDEKTSGPWCGSAERIAGSAHAHIAQGYMNVVEDARIEKLMKEKFPGMRRDFFKAYEQFIGADFFGIKGRDINTLPFIDRINLHYKMGTCTTTGINFSPVEQSFITRIDNCRTFDEVSEIVADLWEYESRLKEEAEKQNAQGSASSNGDSDEQGESTPMQGDSDNSDEQGEDGQSGESQGDDGEKRDGNSSSSGNQGGEDKNNSSSGDGKASSTGNGSAKKYENETLPPAPSTQEKFDNSVKKMTDTSSRTYDYYVLPTSANLDNIICTYPQIRQIIEEWKNSDAVKNAYNGSTASAHETLMIRAAEEYTKFAAESAPMIALMAKQFDLRKAADAAKRTSVARTGVLDTIRMVNYRISEDIFRRNTTVREGKNHGLVMFIDWSGSMASTLMDTVKQLVQIALFCRRCNIPFEVYAFSTVCLPGKKTDKNVDVYDSKNYWVDGPKTTQQVARFNGFTLFNFLSSKMRPNQFKEAMATLFAITMVNNSSYPSYHAMPGDFGLSSTPLDESILAAMEIVPKFREDNRLQVVHTVFLTDGQTSGAPFSQSGYYSRVFVTDPHTRKTYESHKSSTDTMLQIFRDRTKTNAIGFFLLSGRNRVERFAHLFTPHTMDNKGNYRGVQQMSQKDHEYVKKQYESYRSDGFCVAHPTATGYTEQFLVRADTKIDDTDEMKSVNTNSSMTQIKNAFIRNAGKRMKCRVMLNRFIDLIAS
jgi:hypothetical protein